MAEPVETARLARLVLVKRLTRTFFNQPLLLAAEQLLGMHFLWNGCGGRVVEVEAYAVEGDAACHTASRPSSREFVRCRPPGTAYVYLNYGMYWLLNVLVRDGILLVRALEPTHGIEVMQQRRRKERLRDLCSGPGKIGVALALNRTVHGTDLTARDCPGGFFAPIPASPLEIITDVRIGISAAVDLPWRYLAKDNPHVSVPAPAPVAKIGPRVFRKKSATPR